MTEVGVITLAVTRGAFGKDIGTRAADFKTLVSQAASKLQKHLPNAAVQLLVAPEYFFSTFDSYGTTAYGKKGEFEPVTHDKKMDLYKDIAAASKLHPNMIIIAGTIFYIRGKNQVEGLNVCPVAVGGKIKYKIYKQNNDMALQDYNPHSFFETKNKSDPVFSEKGVTFALDICRDHNSGLARDFAVKKNKNIDIHIVVSAGAAPSQCTGKFIVHCDLSGGGQEGVGSAYALDGGKLVKPKLTPTYEKSSSQVHGVKYVCYKLDV